jgi:hypothetical protein
MDLLEDVVRRGTAVFDDCVDDQIFFDLFVDVDFGEGWVGDFRVVVVECHDVISMCD